MTVVAFPSPIPSTQAVLATIYKLGHSFPRWSLELDVSEDGRPSVTAERRATGGSLSAHWDHRGWAVLDEDMGVVAHAADLWTALSRALV